MAKERRTVDLNALSPEERAKYEERRAKARAPRPAYLVYKTDENGEVDIKDVTRSAEEALAVIDGDKELKYKRFLIK